MESACTQKNSKLQYPRDVSELVDVLKPQVASGQCYLGFGYSELAHDLRLKCQSLLDP